MYKSNFSNVREIIQNGIKKYENNNAFIVKDENKNHVHITYKRFGEDIEKLGRAFIKMGLQNKKIAIIGKNRYEWALCYCTVLYGVGIAVPLDKGLPENEIENSLIISEADVIIFEEKSVEEIKNIKNRKKTKVTTYICMDTGTEFTSLQEVLEIGNKELKNKDNNFNNLKIDNDKTSIIVFTSGTTSMAKAVELSQKNIASNVNGMNEHETFLSTDVNMAFLPFHHTFGSTALVLFLGTGTTTVFCDGLRYVQKNLKEYRVTIFFCVPLIIEAMYKKIMIEIEKQGKLKLVKFAKILSKILLKFKIDIRRKLFKDIIDNLGGGIRVIINGAAAIDPKISKEFNEFGILTIQGYGLTETSPVLCAENENCLRLGSIGKPLPNVEMKIDDPDEEGIGEIIAKGPNIMNGYYKNKKQTEEVLQDGWFHTGDYGRIDKDGYFFVSGRKKNVIVLKNGKNIYPEELEVLIAKLQYVKENFVFGAPKDDDLVITAKIVYDKDYMKSKYNTDSEDEIKDIIWNDIKKINKELCNYKHIKKLVISDEPMIKTTTNKIKRNEEMKRMDLN